MVKKTLEVLRILSLLAVLVLGLCAIFRIAPWYPVGIALIIAAGLTIAASVIGITEEGKDE